MIYAFLNNPQLLINEFNELIDVAQSKSFITVGIEIQKNEIEVLRRYQENLQELKAGFIARHLENEANLVWCLISSVNIIENELLMLVNIKEDKMAEAWANLVRAQVVIGCVMRNHPFDSSQLEGQVRRLSSYEEILFPKMFFQSVGGIIKKSECSICHKDLDTCDHLKGKLYWGELCYRVITEMDLEEVSLVENPANKLCRIISIEKDGAKWDVLTLRSLPIA